MNASKEGWKQKDKIHLPLLKIYIGTSVSIHKYKYAYTH